MTTASIPQMRLLGRVIVKHQLASIDIQVRGSHSVWIAANRKAASEPIATARGRSIDDAMTALITELIRSKA